MRGTDRFTIQRFMLIRLMRIEFTAFGVRSHAAKTAESTGMYWPIGVTFTRITMPFLCILMIPNILLMATMGV